MSNQPMVTLFLPGERTNEQAIVQQTKQIAEQRIVLQFLDSIQDILVVLNQERQIVYGNQNLLSWLGMDVVSQVCGLRLGEAMHCLHARELEGGCGTTEYCRVCGAARAILASQQGRNDMQTCRILRDDGQALDLEVKTSQISIDGNDFTILSAKDISHENRRRALERIFYHDVMNTIGNLHGVTDLLRNALPDEQEEIKETIYSLSEQIKEEIQSQRILTSAESGDLKLEPSTINSLEIFYRVIQAYRKKLPTDEYELKIEDRTENVTFFTDRVLLTRVVHNMVKNAIEASKSGDPITMGCLLENEERIQFWVNNPAYIPRDTQLQIFQRAFSTKGMGRGLGTYSIKLLTERYLKGSVSFSSTQEEGTTFRISIPKEI